MSNSKKDDKIDYRVRLLYGQGPENYSSLVARSRDSIEWEEAECYREDAQEVRKELTAKAQERKKHKDIAKAEPAQASNHMSAFKYSPPSYTSTSYYPHAGHPAASASSNSFSGTGVAPAYNHASVTSSVFPSNPTGYPYTTGYVQNLQYSAAGYSAATSAAYAQSYQQAGYQGEQHGSPGQYQSHHQQPQHRGQ